MNEKLGFTLFAIAFTIVTGIISLFSIIGAVIFFVLSLGFWITFLGAMGILK